MLSIYACGNLKKRQDISRSCSQEYGNRIKIRELNNNNEDTRVALHDNFPRFLGFGFLRKIAHKNTQ